MIHDTNLKMRWNVKQKYSQIMRFMTKHNVFTHEIPIFHTYIRKEEYICTLIKFMFC